MGHHSGMAGQHETERGVNIVRNLQYWKEVAENPNPDDINSKLGKPVNDIHKVIFSNTLKVNQWDNATIICGDIAEEIKNLKENKGKDIVVYGDNSFVSSLVEHKLTD